MTDPLTCYVYGRLPTSYEQYVLYSFSLCLADMFSAKSGQLRGPRSFEDAPCFAARLSVCDISTMHPWEVSSVQATGVSSSGWVPLSETLGASEPRHYAR